jgi:hypothetical protein
MRNKIIENAMNARNKEQFNDRIPDIDLNDKMNLSDLIGVFENIESCTQESTDIFSYSFTINDSARVYVRFNLLETLEDGNEYIEILEIREL